MEWTREPPQEAGWYWYRRGPGRRAGVVHVGDWPGGGLAVDVYGYGGGPGVLTPEQAGGEWAGPLAPPSEALVDVRGCEEED